MKKLSFLLFLFVVSIISVFGQTLQDARRLYTEGLYAEALPIFEKEFQTKPKDASINHWYGVCLYMTDGDLNLAEQCLLFASGRKVQEANLYLGMVYTKDFKFEEAQEYFDKFETNLNRKGRRTKAQQEQEDIDKNRLSEHKKTMQQLRRMVSHTEDIQIIDSIIVNKDQLLNAYHLSPSGGRIANFSEIFESNLPVQSVVYLNEKATKMYFAQPDTARVYGLYTMEYLLDHFGNEKQLSKNNFGLDGEMNFPFVMPDGVTVYFAAKDSESLGGYDLFISRYNLNTDTYLKPERLNMPFNSEANDYMMVVDEEKNIGWFASDRNMEEGKVCVYTFIPNSVVKIIQSEDNRYLANRARINSIRDTWQEGVNYSKDIAEAKRKPIIKEVQIRDFELVINETRTYYTLTDFTNKVARDNYFKIIQQKAELKALQEKLDDQRDQYAKGDESRRNSLMYAILNGEKSETRLYAEIKRQEMRVVNLENSSLIAR